MSRHDPGPAQEGDQSAQLASDRDDLEAERTERQEAERSAENLEAAVAPWHRLPVATCHPYLHRKLLEDYPLHDVR